MLSMPLLMLAHIISNRVHFMRTILPAIAICTPLAVYGVEACAHLGSRLLRRFTRAAKYRRKLFSYTLTVLCVLSILAFHGRFENVLERNLQRDSRDQVINWILNKSRVPNSVFIAKDLHLSTLDLKVLSQRNIKYTLISWGMNKEKNLATLDENTLVLLPSYGHKTLAPPYIRKFPVSL